MADLLTLGANASLLYKSALSTVSNNIANLTTEGYSRQTIDVEENAPDAIGSTFIGTGATLNSVTRSYDAFAENSLRQSNSELVGQYELIDYSSQIVDVLGSDTAGLNSALDQFFISAGSLASDPASSVLRNDFLNQATSVAIRFNDLGNHLVMLEQDSQFEIDGQLSQLNTYSQQLVTLNAELARYTSVSDQPPQLLDRRDKTLMEMSSIAKIHVIESASGTVEVRLDSAQGTTLVDKRGANTLSAVYNDPQLGDVDIVSSYGVIGPISDVTGGRLGGLVSSRDELIKPSIADLDALAVEFADEVNAIQTTGVDINGVRGTDMFDATGGAVAINMLLTDADNVATGGLLSIDAAVANTGGASMSHEVIPAGTATPAFTVTFTDGAGGYSINDGPPATTGTLDANNQFIYGGITYTLSEIPDNTDNFSVGLNTSSPGDNRNMLLMSDLQSRDVMPGGGTLSEGYNRIYTDSSTRSTLATISSDALQVVYDQAVATKDRVSGVNLDEEAADLIRYQQAFQAAAQVMSASSVLFDAILAVR